MALPAILAGLVTSNSAAQIPDPSWMRVEATDGVSLSVPPGTSSERVQWDDALGSKLKGPGFELLVYYGTPGLSEESSYKVCSAVDASSTSRIQGKKAAIVVTREPANVRLSYFVGLCIPEANVDPGTSLYFVGRGGQLVMRTSYVKLIALGHASDASTADQLKRIYQTVQVK
jgi:hypothetical protein